MGGEAKEIIGVFIGLESSTYEYIATIIAPYKAEFLVKIGSFILIENGKDKIVARVIDFVPKSELTSFMGLKWLNDMAFEAESAIGSDIKKRKISYSVKIKLLGAIGTDGSFTPGIREIPHITSRVTLPHKEELSSIINTALKEQEHGIKIGSYFLDNSIEIKFDLRELDSKRTFVFARAGYGKSNLMKVIASKWQKGAGSLLIFDPDGEYAFTDRKNRPGIMDKREAILITNRKDNPTTNNISRNLSLNLKEFPPKFIIPIIVPAEKHSNIFYNKLMGLKPEQWSKLVDLLYKGGWATPLREIKNIIHGEEDEKETDNMQAIRNNLASPIADLHDPDSRLIDIIESAIKSEATIIMDISLLDSKTALRLSSVIVKWIFNQNQSNFIRNDTEDLFRVTFVIDEAQSVLSKEYGVDAFIDLAKEGRKYALGGVFITQQPASIPFEILSQADNFFVFHLLSKGDLVSLQNSNAHYSNDIVTQILSEPIKGKCYMWTSSQPFVLPVKIDNFEDKEIIRKSKEVQDKSKLLTDITAKIREENDNPTMKKIIEKLIEVEKKNEGAEEGDKSTKLFKSLTEEEKEYLRKEKGIQSYEDKEFAIRYPYYRKIKKLANL